MKKAFDIPTIADLAAYAREINYSAFKPEAFIDYWEMRAWQIRPGIKMASWKAAVRTWQRNDWTAVKSKNHPDQRRAQHMHDEKQMAEYIDQITAIRSWKGKECPYGDPAENFRRLIDKIRDTHGPQFLAKLREKMNAKALP